MKDPSLVSLMEQGIVLDPAGLCSGRFRADIATTDVDYAGLRPGDTVQTGGRTLTIVSVGKRCHPECGLLQSGRVCMLKHRCAFGRETE